MTLVPVLFTLPLILYIVTEEPLQLVALLLSLGSQPYVKKNR